MKNLTPGKDRPFTMEEFGAKIAKLAEEQKLNYFDRLDYCIPDGKEQPMNTPWISFRHKTDFGGCEGVYADLYVVIDEKEFHFLTAKTLNEGAEAYVEMNTLAARLIVIAREFVRSNWDVLAWKGYDLGFEKEDGTIYWRNSCLNDYKEEADYLKSKGYTVYVRDNAVRKVFKYV